MNVIVGGADDKERDRARFRGLFYGVVLLDYGVSVAAAALAAVGRTALRFALS
ncbi:MAG: hypothetical protein ACYTDX_05620 [Planctomycetota bacterium]